jgi:hypothetical protein
LARTNAFLPNKECPIVLPELIVNERIYLEKEKFYNSNGTQTIFVEEKEDENLGDDIEIIPSNILQDDFIQLDFNECNEQPNIVNTFYFIFSF